MCHFQIPGLMGFKVGIFRISPAIEAVVNSDNNL